MQLLKCLDWCLHVPMQLLGNSGCWNVAKWLLRYSGWFLRRCYVVTKVFLVVVRMLLYNYKGILSHY